MNPLILHKEVQEFIVEKSDTSIDINKLILSGSPFEGISVQELAQQIVGRQKAQHKLPTWYSKTQVYYPPKLNLEQTSSEVTAQYKSKLVSGNTVLDVTGGFGIDDYSFAKRMEQVIHCELNASLSNLAAHNFEVLGVKNVQCVVGDGLEILKKYDSMDWVYIDPSRRHDQKGKVFFLEDCLPNVPQNLEFIFSKTDNILIKTSPLLDLNAGIRSLQYVKEIHVVAADNEVKELLWVLHKDFNGDCIIKAINIVKDEHQEFSFYLHEEVQQPAQFGAPKSFLYEPNASILKSGGFLNVGKAFDLDKLHQHSHLYTSDTKIDFPGRCFEIIAVFPYQKKVIAKAGITKANITIRNFPESVASLRKKHKIKDGGEIYLFFTTDLNEKKIVIQCKKV